MPRQFWNLPAAHNWHALHSHGLSEHTQEHVQDEIVRRFFAILGVHPFVQKLHAW